MSNEKMSGDDILSVLDNEIRALPAMVALIRHGEHQCDETPAAKRLQKAREAVAALIAERDALREDEKRLDWMQSDMTNGDDGVGIYWSDGGFVFPYLVSNAGGSGGGVGVAFFETLREAIDSARANEST